MQTKKMEIISCPRGGETQLIFSHMDIPSYKTALLVSQYYNLDLLHLVVLDG